MQKLSDLVVSVPAEKKPLFSQKEYQRFSMFLGSKDLSSSLMGRDFTMPWAASPPVGEG